MLNETQEKIETEAKELNQTIQTQYQQIKADVLGRLDVIKSQLTHSQGDLSEAVEVLKKSYCNSVMI